MVSGGQSSPDGWYRESRMSTPASMIAADSDRTMVTNSLRDASSGSCRANSCVGIVGARVFPLCAECDKNACHSRVCLLTRAYVGLLFSQDHG